MKFFAVFVFAVIIAVTYAAPMQQQVRGQEFGRDKKSYGPVGYGGPSIPCPKSVVVSCAPLLQKVPCKGSSGGHAGAYSEYVPQYLPYTNENSYNTNYEY